MHGEKGGGGGLAVYGEEEDGLEELVGEAGEEVVGVAPAAERGEVGAEEGGERCVEFGESFAVMLR